MSAAAMRELVEARSARPDVVAAGGGWRLSALLRIDEVAARYRAPAGDYETIGGLVLQELGHIPKPGETVKLTAFAPDGPLTDPVHWLATVVSDGLPPHRPTRAHRAGRPGGSASPERRHAGWTSGPASSCLRILPMSALPETAHTSTAPSASISTFPASVP